MLIAVCCSVVCLQFAHPGESTELTFNVKEVRAFLSYVDGLVDFDVKLHYQTSGDPIMLDMRLRHAYGGPEDPMGTQAVQGPMEMKLVVATLADPQTASHQPTPQPAGQPATPNSQQHLRGSQQAQIEASFQQKQSAAAIVGEATRDDMSVPATPQE
jgi:hypothetical protein